MNPVLHRVAQPIAVPEFYDALRAAAAPRFPQGRSVWHRRVGLAVSGGVDSMALAFLSAQLRRARPFLRVADAPTSGFTALVVDHGLRAGSAAEAEAVAAAVRALGHRVQVWPLVWPAGWDLQGPLSGMSGMETMARRLRYRCLGLRLAQLKIVSLLLAHHADDQYETVLMRLAAGHGRGGVRGLRGMRRAGDLPECHGLYGAHQSGFGDDQRARTPYVLLRPSRRERRHLQSAFRADMEGERVWAGGLEGGVDVDAEVGHPPLHRLLGRAAPPLPPLATEDLGIVAYRPLLAFGKDRLVATCTAHGVPWFEDPTNADRTLTLRNAVRHLVADPARLPPALRKPAVLRLAARCDAAARQHEAEARRWLVRHRAVVRFSPNVGTVVARLPPLRARARRRPRFRTRRSRAYRRAGVARRRRHLRTVAALAVQSLLGLVAPEARLPPVAQLHAAVDALFPGLAERPAGAGGGYAQAFVIGGVHCMPVGRPADPPGRPDGRSWYLARAPYAAADPPPAVAYPPLSLAHRWDRSPAQWPWSRWSRWRLYDGRFWVRLRSRLPANLQLQPFAKEHGRPLRDAVAAASGPAAAAALAATLKTYAPGKVRFTLPALYVAADVEWALQGWAYWPEEGQGRGEPGRTDGHDDHGHQDPPDQGPSAVPYPQRTGDRQMDRYLWERELRRREQALWAARPGPSPSSAPSPPWRLLALPTLGVHLPGIEHWLQWEVRYRKVDRRLLEDAEA